MGLVNWNQVYLRIRADELINCTFSMSYEINIRNGYSSVFIKCSPNVLETICLLVAPGYCLLVYRRELAYSSFVESPFI